VALAVSALIGSLFKHYGESLLVGFKRLHCNHSNSLRRCGGALALQPVYIAHSSRLCSTADSVASRLHRLGTVFADARSL
jgi:hypothetical protein